MCLVSVLVPIYGVEQYIERCARSLFEQTYPNIEFVFVNDCTRDRSVEILMQVLKDYPHRAEMVKLINHDSNRGIASTRNTALENATGEFVFYVDSDDWTEIEAIESLVKKQKETNADIVSGNMYIHSHQGVTKFFQPEYDGKEQMILMQFPSTHDHDLFRRIVRRSLFEDHCIRCIEGCNMAEDRYIMVQLCFYAKMVSVIEGAVKVAEKLLKPGTLTTGLSGAVNDYLEKNGYLMPHNLGHGIGLYIHEKPFLRAKVDPVKLEKGMVFTIEPGVYDPKLGGVRLENDYLITENVSRSA